jgi:hypothetical protein
LPWEGDAVGYVSIQTRAFVGKISAVSLLLLRKNYQNLFAPAKTRSQDSATCASHLTFDRRVCANVANREKTSDRGRILMLTLPATRRVMLAANQINEANFGPVLVKARLSSSALNN